MYRHLHSERMSNRVAGDEEIDFYKFMMTQVTQMILMMMVRYKCYFLKLCK